MKKTIGGRGDSDIGGEEVAEKEVANLEKDSTGTAPEDRRRPRRGLKTIIMGIGVILVIIGIALAVYVATYEDGGVLTALVPAFIGVVVIIAALRGKRL